MADLNLMWLARTRYCPLFYKNVRVQCFQTALLSRYEMRCLDCLVYFKVHAIFNLSCGRKNVLSRMCHPRLSSVSTHECCRMKGYFRRSLWHKGFPQHILIWVHTYFAQINRRTCKSIKNGIQHNSSTRRTKIVPNSEPPHGWTGGPLNSEFL